MDLKTQLETVAKNHQASIQNLETKFDRLVDKQSGRPSGSLPSNTQPNPRGSNSKAYQPPQSRNEHVNVVFTRSGKSYDPPDNPNDQQNNSENPINFESDNEDDEPTSQPKTQLSKPVKETPLPKPYKPKIPYPQRLRKEKMEAQYGKPRHDPSRPNQLPPKLGDPGSFLIPCNFNKTFSCNALADLSAIINLMSYSLYAKLSLETLKPTKMSIRLADRSFQYHVGIAENMLFEVVIRVKQKQVNLRVGTERIIFNIDSSIKHSYSNNDTCFSINVIDEILEEDFDSLLDEGRKILHSIEGTVLEEEIFSKFDKFIAMIFDEIYDSESDTEEPPFKKITINTDYKIKTFLEEPPTNLELKPLPDNLEYIFLEEPSFILVIISSKLSAQNKSKLIQLLDDKKPVVQKQRRLNPNMQEVVKKEIMKLLDTGIIYLITDSPWVSPIHCVPKKGGIIVVTNKNDELVPTRTVTGCPNWKLPFELMCDASDFTVGVVLALKHLFKKQDAKPRLIRWILLLQGFDIEIKDRKGTENVAADHLSRIENDEISDDSEVDDNFLGETLMEINTKNEPWFADFANYLVGDIIPKRDDIPTKEQILL
ncbi:reverse transcriptase domain-containing protein [Tanacetum coccineum]